MEGDNKRKGEESHERRFRVEVNSTIAGLNLLSRTKFLSR